MSAGELIVDAARVNFRLDPNDLLGDWLVTYRCNHPLGPALDWTVANCNVRIGSTFRHVTRAIWAKLGRQPHDLEPPQIVVEFASTSLPNTNRHRSNRCREFRAAGVQEFWTIDRYTHSATVHRVGDRLSAAEIYGRNGWVNSPLLPGFELSLRKLFGIANYWEKY